MREAGGASGRRFSGAAFEEGERFGGPGRLRRLEDDNVQVDAAAGLRGPVLPDGEGAAARGALDAGDPAGRQRERRLGRRRAGSKKKRRGDRGASSGSEDEAHRGQS